MKTIYKCKKSFNPTFGRVPIAHRMPIGNSNTNVLGYAKMIRENSNLIRSENRPNDNVGIRLANVNVIANKSDLFSTTNGLRYFVNKSVTF